MRLRAPPRGGGALPRILTRVTDDFQIPGFVNAHSHAFQRALRGRVEGRDFWSWREAMLELAAGVRTDYRAVFAEMRAAGYTAVGEFHYLGVDEALAAAEAATATGIELVVLYVAYARGVRSCPGGPLARIVGRVTIERILDRLPGIRINEAHHGPADARHFDYAPLYIIRGLQKLHVEFTAAS